MKKKFFNNNGFTLTELIIVIALIAILSSLSIFSFTSMRTNMRLSGATREVYSVLQQARLRAAKEQSFVVVDFDPDLDGVLEQNFISFVDDNADFIRNGTEELLYNTTLHRDIQITSAVFGAANKFTCFNKNGFPSDSATNLYNGSIVLSNGTNTHTVSLNTLGLSTIQ